MCNPNALYYQQMVTSPNAYWLNFFLKRDINVLCWNYRGYGDSTKGFMEVLSPYKSKRDAEYVMAYLVNKLRVRGKIGVYGRSIGGLTACHLANKYNDLVQALVVDRSFYELQSVPAGKIKGDKTARLFDFLSWKWRTLNHSNFAATTNCYKIVTCDPLDDTVDLFSNLCTGVGSQLATVDYDTERYRRFYETLLAAFAIENQIYEGLDDSKQDYLLLDVAKVVDAAEQDLEKARLAADDEIEEESSGNQSRFSTSLNPADESSLDSMPDGDLAGEKKRKGSRLACLDASGRSGVSAAENPTSKLPRGFDLGLIQQILSQSENPEFKLFKDLLHLIVITIADLTAGTMEF